MQIETATIDDALQIDAQIHEQVPGYAAINIQRLPDYWL